METLVELYVHEQFDDLAAVLAFRPERVVFLTSGYLPGRAEREGVLRSLSGISPSTKAVFIDVGDRSLDSLFKKLDGVVKDFPDCAVEMTGGSASVLIAAERYCEEKRVKSFYFDSFKGRFRNIYGMEGELSRVKTPVLDVETLLKLSGGLMTGTGHASKPFFENRETVLKTLDIYRQNIDQWNAFSEYLQFACKSYLDEKHLFFCAPMTLLSKGSLYFINKRIINALYEAGAVTNLLSDGENVSFYFKNSFFRELLTTVGMCLELMVYSAAVESGAFDSAEMSVLLDWDGVISGHFNDTVNEIDVIMTSGLSSFFVSCKSSRPDTRDLYEIGYLAKRFGGRNAVPVLATAVDLSGSFWANYMRARDMGVTVIERADIVEGSERIVKLLMEPEWLAERPSR